MPEFVTAQDVRDYLKLDGTTGKYSDALLGSNIRAASAFLQRETRRQFEVQTAATKHFTTEGAAIVDVPDLRTVTTVTLEDVTLTADETFWLIPDPAHGEVYRSVQVRQFGQWNYRAHPQWFDRNLDRLWPVTTPNDLTIVGDWGWDPLPEELLHATKVLASFYTKRPDSVLSDSQVTPEGALLRYSQLPLEVREFIAGWRVASAQLTAVG